MKATKGTVKTGKNRQNSSQAGSLGTFWRGEKSHGCKCLEKRKLHRRQEIMSSLGLQKSRVATTPQPGTVLIVYLLMSIYLRTTATESVNQTLGELLV